MVAVEEQVDMRADHAYHRQHSCNLDHCRRLNLLQSVVYLAVVHRMSFDVEIMCSNTISTNVITLIVRKTPKGVDEGLKMLLYCLLLLDL